MLSNYLAGELLKASVKDVSFTSGSPLYLALLKAPGVAADTGTMIMAKEVAYGGYQRAAVPSSAWGEPEGQAITNVEEIALPTWTSGGAQVVGWALCDAAMDGNVHHIGITAAFKIDEQDPEPVIGPGLLRVVFA